MRVVRRTGLSGVSSFFHSSLSGILFLTMVFVVLTYWVTTGFCIRVFFLQCFLFRLVTHFAYVKGTATPINIRIVFSSCDRFLLDRTFLNFTLKRFKSIFYVCQKSLRSSWFLLPTLPVPTLTHLFITTDIYTTSHWTSLFFFPLSRESEVTSSFIPASCFRRGTCVDMRMFDQSFNRYR